MAQLTRRSDRNVRAYAVEALGDPDNPKAHKAEIVFPGGKKFEVVRLATGKNNPGWRYYFRKI
ncbi:MAG: hypothetical protein ACOVQ7_27710 [Limnoraphis robusta]